MILDINNKSEVAKYNDFVKNSGYGHFQQDMRWARLKSTWSSVYFYIKENDNIKAAMSVIFIKDSKVNKNFFYAPRGPVCDLKDIDLVKELVGEAYNFAKENDGFLLRIDPLYPYDEDLIKAYKNKGIDIRFDKKRSSQPLLNMVLEIDGRNVDEIFSKFSKNTRKHTKKSYRDGISTKQLGDDGIDILYEQIVDTAQRAGIGHRPYEYFKTLYELYKDEIRLSGCFYEDEPVCTSLLILYGNRATSLYGGSSNKYKDMAQNYQINFEEIKYSVENGMAYYDMGGIFEEDKTDGLYTFKRKFTEDNVEKLIGEIDLVIDEEKYVDYMTQLNPHFKRLADESNQN